MIYPPNQSGKVAPMTMRQRFTRMFTRNPTNPLNNYTAMSGPPTSPRPRRTFRNMFSRMFRRNRSQNSRHRASHRASANRKHSSRNKNSINRSRNRSNRGSLGSLYNYDPTQGMSEPSYSSKKSHTSLHNSIKQRKKHIELVLSIPKDSDQSTDDFYADRLIQILTSSSKNSESEIDNIISELTSIANMGPNVKKGHWIWWIFPTERAGKSDDLKTRVTGKTANRFLNNLKHNSSLEEKWKKCIELTIASLNCQILSNIEKIPEEDTGRLEHFCKFWNGWGNGSTKPVAKHVPQWLQQLCSRLENALIKIND